MLARLLIKSAPAPPAPSGPRHTFNFQAGGSGSVGYNGPGGFGSVAAGSSAVYALPNGRNVTIQHCRNVRDVVNFAIAPQSIPLDQFPATIVLLNNTANRMITVKRPGSVRNIGGDTITRGDYEIAPAGEQVTRQGYAVQTTLPLVLVSNQAISAELYD